MSNGKVLYIIGAGASKEVKMPTGNELKGKIIGLLSIEIGLHGEKSGRQNIYDALVEHIRQQNQRLPKDLEPYLEAANLIQNAMPQAISIDNFIDNHKGNLEIELCGKLAILHSILDAERHCLLYSDNLPNFHNLEQTWYASFLKLLCENCTKDNLPGRLDSIAFVIFNYDRCVEHFLYTSLINYYGIRPPEAGKLVNEITIYHPYGVVGKLPWQGDPSASFGAKLSPPVLLNTTREIKTFTEGTDLESSEILAIRKEVVEAGRVVFLGFAYHELNMRLLMYDNSGISSSNVHCFGTAKGISRNDCEIIAAKLIEFFKSSGHNMHIRNDVDCYHLFDEYKRSLSFKK